MKCFLSHEDSSARHGKEEERGTTSRKGKRGKSITRDMRKILFVKKTSFIRVQRVANKLVIRNFSFVSFLIKTGLYSVTYSYMFIILFVEHFDYTTRSRSCSAYDKVSGFMGVRLRRVL